MKHKTAIIVLSIVLAASVGLNLGGIGMMALVRMRARRHLEEPGQPLVRRLKLTEDQRDDLRIARKELGKATGPLREEMGNKRREIVELLMADQLDSARRDSLFTEIARLQTEMELLVFDKLFEAKTVLNPEQQEHLLQMIQKEFHHMPGPLMQGPHNGHPGPGRTIDKKCNQERSER